jgi:uncharacterized membrane protein
MSRDLEWRERPAAESVSRLVNFTDAVAAIAVTLLVLPMLDIEPPADGESIWSVMGANSGIFLAFVLSFAITLSYWRRHHRFLDGLQTFTPMLVWINGLWLLALIFVQFPTEMIGRSGPQGGTATLYIGTLALVTWISIAMILYLKGVPGLIPVERQIPTVQVLWTSLTAAYLTAAALLGLFAPGAAMWALVGLAPLGWLESWQLARQAPDQERTAAT